jgi:catechol 2,3-dioxygenase-like lactoylglutathione lyase family enzyme
MATVSVRYIVDDVDAAIAFYCAHLGFTEKMHPAPTFAMVGALRQAGAHFRNDTVTGVGGKQILLNDPSGNPVELFEPTRPEAALNA